MRVGDRNLTWAEVSWLCPAILSLIKLPDGSTRQNYFNKDLTINDSSYSSFTINDIIALLGKSKCGADFSSYVNNEGKRKNTLPDFREKHARAVGHADYVAGLAMKGRKRDDLSSMDELGVGTNSDRTFIYPTNIIKHGEFENKQTVDVEVANDEYWPMDVRILMSFIFSLLSIIGIVGNILVVTVVIKVPRMITPTNCYLVSLAISDCMFFVATAPTELSYLHVPSSKYIFGEIGCALFSYLPYLAINTSSLSITAFTIERFIGICYPLRARYICTVKRAQSIIFFIWVFCIIYNSPWLYLATLKEDLHGQICSFKLARDNWTYKVMFLGDFAAFYLIPMILYIYIYGKMTYTLSRCGFRCSEVHDNNKTSTFMEKRNSIPDKKKVYMVLSNPNDSPSTTKSERQYCGGSRKNSTKGKVQVVKMLALVVLIFAVCWLPYRAMVMYNSFVSTSRLDPDWYIFFSKTLIFFNCSINPILYNLMSSRFRSAFKRFLNERRCLKIETPLW